MSSKICPIHPRYQGKRRPINKFNPKCRCVDVFIEKHDNSKTDSEHRPMYVRGGTCR